MFMLFFFGISLARNVSQIDGAFVHKGKVACCRAGKNVLGHCGRFTDNNVGVCILHIHKYIYIYP